MATAIKQIEEIIQRLPSASLEMVLDYARTIEHLNSEFDNDITALGIEKLKKYLKLSSESVRQQFMDDMLAGALESNQLLYQLSCWIETADIELDQNLKNDITEGKLDIEAGKWVDFDELKKQLGL